MYQNIGWLGKKTHLEWWNGLIHWLAWQENSPSVVEWVNPFTTRSIFLEFVHQIMGLSQAMI
jgi:hypothetical protein